MLSFRFAEKGDAAMYFAWANDEVTRANSYTKEQIPFESHVAWFNRKVDSPDCNMYVFVNEKGEPVGQIRLEYDISGIKKNAVIGISIDSKYRGRGYAVEMLKQATDDFLKRHQDLTVIANVFVANEASYKSFLKAGYQLKEQKDVSGVPSYILEKR